MAHVMLVSDLDHTMVQNEDTTHKRLLAFDHLWTTHCSKPENLLVFSTGRSPVLFKKLWQEAPLLTPDVLICSVGSEIFYNTQSRAAALLLGEKVAAGGSVEGWAEFTPDPHWESVLDEGWSRSKVEEVVRTTCPQLTKQADTEQRPHKLSYILPESARVHKPKAAAPEPPAGYSPGEQAVQGAAVAATTTAASKADPCEEPVIQALREALRAEGLKAKVVYSGGQDVDVLAEGAGKGCGLAFLMKRLKEAGHELQYVQVNGDSGNDAELLDVPGVVGCVVSNAHPELRQYAVAKEQQGDKHVLQASNPCAGGIVQTMVHFGLLAPSSPVLSTYKDLIVFPKTAGAPSGHGPLTQHPHPSTVPDAVQPAPPGGTAVGWRGNGVREDGADVEAAAKEVGKGWEVSPLGVGDTCLQHTAVGAPEQLAGLTGSSGDAEAAVQIGGTVPLKGDGRIVGLSALEAVKEWAWRMGSALAEELVQGRVADGKVAPHSPLRLFITNDCVVDTQQLSPVESSSSTAAPTGAQQLAATGAGSAGEAPGAGVLEGEGGIPDAAPPLVVDLQQELVPEGAKDAAAHDAHGLVARSWVDQLRVNLLSLGLAPAPEAAGEEDPQPLYEFTAQFKVCFFNADGMRSDKSWLVEVHGVAPQEPVPHGYLADRITLAGPLAAQQTELNLPGDH